MTAALLGTLALLLASARADEPSSGTRCGLGCTLWRTARAVDAFSNDRESLDLFSGAVRVQRKAGAAVAEPGAGVPEDMSVELGAESLAESVERFLQTHVVRMQLPSEGENARDAEVTYDLGNLVAEEGRNRGRGKLLRRLLIPLLIGLKLKAGVLFPLFFTAVTVIAVKALGAGVVALLLSSVLGLKALVDSSRTSKLSVEVRPHSTVEHQYHHSHHHVDSHWAPGWGRDDDLQPYRGHYDEVATN